MSNNLARVYISHEMLITALCLPEDTEIIGARNSMDRIGAVEFIFRHPDFETVIEGANVPTANPIFKSIYQSVVQFEDWNLE